jgi:alanine-glyoxylate transaminase/serine-glyoxylate transaminase/serine-pyruvate transaminase
MANPISIPQRVLLGPGPSDVPPRVLQALAQPTIGHLDPVFLKVMDAIRSGLKHVFRTENEMTLAVSGTGSAGMETAFVNLVEPGDRVLVGVNGVFGGRMVDVAQRCGAQVQSVEAPWGQIIEQERMIEAMRTFKPKVTAIVHAETSTGVHQPVDRLGEAAHAIGSLFLLDCVTSLCGLPVEIDRWGVDAAYSGTQKCLSCPPGLSPVTLSPRAVDALQGRKSKVQSWYLDLNMVRQYWGHERFYHHTAPINMLYGLCEALAIVMEEGLEQRFARHRAMHELLRAGLHDIGIEYVSQEGHHLPMLNAIRIPDGADDLAVRRQLLEDYGIEIGGGLGAFKGKAWRIGLMGHGSSRRNVTLLLAALRDILSGAR